MGEYRWFRCGFVAAFGQVLLLRLAMVRRILYLCGRKMTLDAINAGTPVFMSGNPSDIGHSGGKYTVGIQET